MSIFFAMIPDNVEAPGPLFTREGRLTKNPDTAKRIAKRFSGRVFETTGHATRLVADFYVEPKPQQVKPKAQVRAERADACLFGRLA